MFETLKRLYLTRKLSKTELEKAVDKGWITKRQMKWIIESGD